MNLSGYDTSMKPLFILGVGAQKAGTSWLHKQLNESEFVDMGKLKEYHVWDSLHAEFDGRGKPKFFKKIKQKDFIESLMYKEGKYEKYFLSLIKNDVKITGDITPTYSLLSAEVYKEIRNRILTKGFKIKVIFLMREPVERAWSAWRMKNDGFMKEGKILSDREYNHRFKRFCKGNAFSRTQYNKTIKNLRNSFDNDELFINFYENLFEKRTIKQLSDFLEIDLSYANVNEYVNKSSTKELSSELRDECKKIFQNVYSFCEKEYPITKKIWR